MIHREPTPLPQARAQDDLLRLAARLGCSGLLDAPQSARYASMYADQYGPGEPGHTDACGLRWLVTHDYPIARLHDCVSAEWFASERRMWADEGQPDRYDDMLEGPILNPVIVYDDGRGGWTWDGCHRIGAVVTRRLSTIYALVGVHPTTA